MTHAQSWLTGIFSLICIVGSVYLDKQCQAYPRTVITCEALVKHKRLSTEQQLAQEHKGIIKVNSSLSRSKWIPRSPQLRGRVNQDQRRGQASEWSGRVGTRLYLPSLNTDPPEYRELGISSDDLPDAWLAARQRLEALEVAELHVDARQAWVKLKASQEWVVIHDTRYQISIKLQRTGAIHKHALRQAMLKHELAQLERDQALARWVSALSLIDEAYVGSDQTATRVDPLQTTCVTKPKTDAEWHQLTRQPRLLSTQEAELLFELNQRHTAHSRRRGRWLDFVEVSYDQQGNDTRWIAEVGIDIVPLDPRDSAERLDLHQRRSALRERSDQARKYESRLRAHIEIMRTDTQPQTKLDRPPLNQFSELELYELEVELWQQLWLRHLSNERTLIRWRATHRQD